MRMTIDTAITVLGMVEAYGVCIEAKDIAVDTMHKYQKIVDIVSLNDGEFKQCGLKELKEILEVIADGNKNNHHASNC